MDAPVYNGRRIESTVVINGSLLNYLDDVGGEPVPHVYLEAVAAGGAARRDDALLLQDLESGLGIVALRAQNELLDEDIQHVLQLSRLMNPVDDVTIVLEVELRLSAEFATEELGHVSGRPVERPGDVDHVGDDRLDSVAFPLDLGDQTRHLVPVEGVHHVPVDVESHGVARCDQMLAGVTRSPLDIAVYPS